MVPLDEDADLSDYPVDYRNLVYELNKNSTWKIAATYIARKIKILGNPWLRQLEQAGNCSKSPGDLFLIKLRRLDLCRVGILCEIFQACDLPDALYIVYGSVPMDIDEHLYSSASGKIPNEVAFGESFQLTCRASGLPPPKYQWLHGNLEMPNQTSSTLSLLITSPDQEGEYQCRVSQYDRDEVLVNEEYSRCVPLKIKPTEPEITKQPAASIRIKLGELLSLTCKAESHPIPEYQWYKDDKLLPGQDSETLRIKDFKRENKGRYYCVVSNLVRIKSSECEVTVDYPRQIAKAKIALLIANNEYENHGWLPKAEDDAIALARVLKSMGFQVRCLRNLTLVAMRTEIVNFGKMLEKGVYGLVYFGGHGFQHHDRYLMPIDAPRSEEIGYDDNISEDELVFHLQQKKSDALCIILDMCQWRPTADEMPKLYKSSMPDPYPRKPDPPTVAYSTCPGGLANDPVKGKNGVYMSHVLKHISSDKPMEEVFREIAESVRESADSKTKDQKPMVTTCPRIPYRYLTDAVTTRGIAKELGSTLDEFVKFEPLSGVMRFDDVFTTNGQPVPYKLACRLTLQPLKKPFLNDILLTVSDVDDWEVEFITSPYAQVKFEKMNLGECHIFNRIRRVPPDQTQGLVHIRLTKNRGTKDQLHVGLNFPYVKTVPQTLRHVWLAEDYQKILWEMSRCRGMGGDTSQWNRGIDTQEDTSQK